MIPVDVDERCEFLSPDWLRAAGAFLRREMAARADLHAVRFSFCASFDHAPAALADRAGRAGWHFAIDRGAVDVGSGERADATQRVTGNYQAALGYAQLVHAAGDAAWERGRRELQHRFGVAAVTVTGTVPDDRGLRELLRDLHDYLAAHTIENPDFGHRVEQLGLSAQAAQLDDLGYAVIENAITPEFAEELRELTAAEVTRHHPLTTNGLLLRDRRFEEIAQHAPVCTLAQSAVGQNMILGAMSGTFKEPGPGSIPLHADYPLVRAPFPEFGLIAVAVWALQDWDSEAVGPTWVLPGSHRQRRPPGRQEDVSGGVPILMPRGSVLLISHGIWHWQGDRSAADARVAIHVTYNRVFVRQLDDLGAVGDEHFARNPPAFATLLGRDDPFGKSSYRGHDNKRFAYAGRLTQT